jgi:CyaY protein
MDEQSYQHLADEALKKIAGAFEDVDADDCDCELAGDVLTLTFKGNKRCVVNTQRPTRQMWLAANARAWHFSYENGKWMDDKGRGDELFSTVARISKENGVPVQLG